MKIFSIFLFLFFFSISTYAQDTLYRVNGSKIIVKVLEVNTQTVKYKRTTNLDGPLYVIESSEVLKIVYSNGDVDVFKAAPGQIGANPLGLSKAYDYRLDSIFRPWYISANVFDLVFGIFSVNVEYDVTKQLTVRVPVSSGIYGIQSMTSRNESDVFYYNRYKKYSTGLELHFFPNASYTRSFYIGPAIAYGELEAERQYYNYPAPPIYTVETFKFSSFGFTTGWLIRTTQHLNFSLSTTLGMQLIRTPRYSYNRYQPLGLLEASVGYRFGYKKEIKK